MVKGSAHSSDGVFLRFKYKKGRDFVGRTVKNSLIPLALVFMVVAVFGLRQSLAQQTFTFVGKVTSLRRGDMAVEGEKGETMHFSVGRRTVYIPNRLPGVGERVKVTYYFKRGNNVGNQVEVLPMEAPPSKN